jgi:hypothetical protein
MYCGLRGGEEKGVRYLVHLKAQLVAYPADRALLVLGFPLQLRIRIGVDGRLLFGERGRFPSLEDEQHVTLAEQA